MKHVMDNSSSVPLDSIGATIQKYLDSVKLIVRVMKKTDLDKKLPDSFSLIQEVETRFSTTHDVAKRFIKSSLQLSSFLETLTNKDTLKAFNRITRE